MRVLVTGGAGFIGSNFVHMLVHVSEGDRRPDCCPDGSPGTGTLGGGDFQVLNIDNLTYAANPANLTGIDRSPRYSFARVDIGERHAVEAAFKGFAPDAVVHFAAESHVDRSIADGDIFVRTNVQGTQTLLDAARRHDVEEFLHVGTDEVYGSRLEGSFSESDSLDPSSPYSASKAGSDLLALAHHKTYGLPVTVTRCTNNYGPRQHLEKLLPKLIANALERKALPLYGDGKHIRDWLYVADHCAAIAHILSLRRHGEVFNIASRDERRNLDVARLVLKAADRPDSLISFVQDRPCHDRRYSLDDSKLRATGWSPAIGFEEGLRRTMNWIEARLKEEATG